MTKQMHLKESVAEAPVKKGKRWRVIVARPGVGSSGTYSEDLFRRDADKIIAPGGQAFINHDSTRNPKDMLGVYPEGSFWSEDDKAVVSELEVFSHWESFVDEVGPHCGISLYALGEADEDGNVTSIIPDRLNGADLVARPGLVGSGLAEKLYESAVSHSDKSPGNRQAENKEISNMDQEVKDALKGISDTLAALVADKKTAEAAEAQVKADEAAVAQAVESYDKAVAEIDAADLLPVQVESLRFAAKQGQDVAPLIEAAKKVKEDAVKAVQESARQDEAQGVVLGEASKSFAVSGWGA